MTVVLKFMRGSTALSLMSDTSGLQLAEGWTPKIATPTVAPAGPVIETLQLIAQASTQNALATLMQSLHDMQLWANRYWSDRDEATPVWLHAKLDAETGERRALVHRIDATFGTGWFDAQTVGNQAELTLTIEREPFWEATAETALCGSGVGGLSVIGGAVLDYTASPAADVHGDAPARLATLILAPDSLAAGYDEYWLGWRGADKHPVPGAHLGLWEVEIGTAQSADAANEAATGASPVALPQALRCWFDVGHDGWAERSRLTLGDVLMATGDHGTFLLLLRAKVSANDTLAEVQLRVGFPYNINVYTEIGQVAATDWSLYNLGLLTLPLHDERATVVLSANEDDTAQIQIWARRVLGTGSVSLDCIALIPADELLLHIQHGEVSMSGTWPVSTYIGQAPEGQFGATSLEQQDMQSYIRSAAEVSASGNGIPNGDGRLYLVACQANRVNAVGDSVGVSGAVYPRWLSLRGGD